MISVLGHCEDVRVRCVSVVTVREFAVADESRSGADIVHAAKLVPERPFVIQPTTRDFTLFHDRQVFEENNQPTDAVLKPVPVFYDAGLRTLLLGLS